MEEIKLADKIKCFGCSTCKSVCLHGAITMKKSEGFYYPSINNKRCKSCGLCIDNCIALQYEKVNANTIKRIFSAYSRDDYIRVKSSSGGLSREIINWFYNKYENPKVYGCVLNDQLKAIHVSGQTPKEFDQFYGSKYTMSYLGSVIDDIKRDLKNGSNILFLGTPCQAASIWMAFKNSEYKDKVLIVDIICHGPGSSKLWDDYIAFIEEKYGKINHYYFRDKSGGWRNYSIKIITESEKTVQNTPELKIWSYLFFKGFSQKLSCFNCKFSNSKRFSDITLGDFWGIEKVDPEMTDESGVSFVAVNSNKGLDILFDLKNNIVYREENYEIALATQNNLNGGRDKPQYYEEFWEDYNSKGFIYIAKKYGEYNFIGRIRTRLVNFLRQYNLLIIVKKIVR